MNLKTNEAPIKKNDKPNILISSDNYGKYHFDKTTQFIQIIYI